MWQKFTEDFYFNFIEKDRWLYLVDGLKITLTVTLLAVILSDCHWSDCRCHPFNL